MKILHILSQRPERTGSGIYLQAVIREAARKGHQNFLLAGIPANSAPRLDMIGPDRCRFVHFEGEDLPFPVVGMSDVMPYRSTRFSDLTPQEVEAYENSFSDKLLESFEAFGPDLINSHHLWLMTATAKRLFPDTPIVTTCHGTELRQSINCPQLMKRVRPAIRKINAVMALSRPQKKEIRTLLRLPASSIHVVGGGYDDTLFSAEKKPTPSPVEILYAGKLSQAKGVPWLLKSLRKLTALPWRLHLAGGGSGREKAQCLELAQSLGDRVVVHGTLDHRELAGLMKRTHLFVLASYFEGLPLVLLEALASGCRIVATALPGSKEVLGQAGNRFVCLIDLPPLKTVDAPFAKDEERLEIALAEAIRQQIVDAHKTSQIDMALVKHVTDHYTWPEVFKRVEAVYQTALND
jgi:glycosyltransferase involved in cell wall biosynthesis